VIYKACWRDRPGCSDKEGSLRGFGCHGLGSPARFR
jgi:hypothetical protein